ncbi:hypothetical protein B0H13DRAFT_1920497 [Mycena leptocephala]|nr:hypothetical protein B0H13DRAFT_1920497 [Mycena leptocephala]
MRNPNTLPSPKKKKRNHGHRLKTKPEGTSPTPAEPEVRRAGLERRGGGGGVLGEEAGEQKERKKSNLKFGVRGEEEARGQDSKGERIMGARFRKEEEGGRDEEERKERMGYGGREGWNEAYAARQQIEQKTHHPPNPHHHKINHRIPLLPKPRRLARLPYPLPPRQGREQHMTQDDLQEREQDDAIAWGAPPLLTSAPGQAWGGRGGRTGEGVAHFLQRERGRYAKEREEEVCWETEERGEEEYAQSRGRANGPAEPDAHILDSGHRTLGPMDKGGFRACWRWRAMVGRRMPVGELELQLLSVLS